ncbi:unnamed protein product [marine sediment metagenome]|uniref:Uncharacterized protein n=1 Tax=marine sediment metagenome TaxID=412755 RepID=X1QHS9_9ZZZZ
MSKAPAHRTLSAHVSKYPVYGQARAYLKNFLRHGRRSFIRTKRYAYYKYSLSILVIVIRIAHDIYEVRAYPVDAFFVATLEQALKLHDFRGWLFCYDYRTRSIHYIIGSQTTGVKHYSQVKRVIKSNRTLAQASQAY